MKFMSCGCLKFFNQRFEYVNKVFFIGKLLFFLKLVKLFFILLVLKPETEKNPQVHI
jgi:hypothetical protein